MVTAYLFDQRQGTKIESWVESLQGPGENQVLWFDPADSTEDEGREIRAALMLDDAAFSELGDPDGKLRTRATGWLSAGDRGRRFRRGA